MDKDICEKCSGSLVFGKGKKKLFWCPKCEGLILDSIEESKKFLQNNIKESTTKINDIVKKYDFERLLEYIYITREGVLHLKPPGLMEFMAYSDLLKIIAKFQSPRIKKFDPKGTDCQILLRLAEEVNTLKKMLTLLSNGWIRTIKLKRKEIQKYAYNAEISAITNKTSPKSFVGESIETIIKFTPKWIFLKKNLEDNGFCTPNELYQLPESEIPSSGLNEFWSCIYGRVALELGAGNFGLLEFKNLKNSLDYINILDKIVTELHFKFNFKHEKGWRNFSCELEPVNIHKVFYPLFNKGLDFKYFSDNFIATFGICQGFPIFLLTRNGLFLGPYTSKLTSRFLKAKYFRNYLDANSNIGEEFENLVAKELQENGFSLNQPNDSNKKMMNVVDDEKNPSLEIDIVAQYNKMIYIIECKNIVLSTDFLINNRQKIVESTLKKESIKQKRRIEYIKNNLQKYGYNSGIKKFHNIVVTFNKEPLDKFQDINIVSVKDIKKLKSLIQEKKQRNMKRSVIDDEAA